MCAAILLTVNYVEPSKNECAQRFLMVNYVKTSKTSVHGNFPHCKVHVTEKKLTSKSVNGRKAAFQAYSILLNCSGVFRKFSYSGGS